MTNSQILEHKRFMKRIFKTTTIAEAERTGVMAELYEIERKLHEQKQIILRSESKKIL